MSSLLSLAPTVKPVISFKSRIEKEESRMNAYSRMRSVRGSKSRSMDFSSSDLTAAAPPPEESPNPTKTHEKNQIKNPQQDQEEGGGGAAAVTKLKRNSSVSSSGSSAIKYAVNRAFSMRRSSSVSERYSRIHDQPLDSASPVNATIDEDDDDDDGTAGTLERTGSVKQNKKSSSRGKILKACKKLLGL